MVKVILSKTRINYSVWRRLGWFKHGESDSHEYLIQVFDKHVSRANMSGSLRGKTILEIGPGDSIGTAVIAASYGAKAILLDSGDFATTDISFYIGLTNELRGRGLHPPDLSNVTSLREILDLCSSVYLTGGVTSYSSIESETIDLIFSQAVLEHIDRLSFQDAMRECYRVLKPNGQASHQIDLRDHLGGGLNNLRFSHRIWESRLFRKSGFYTNRLRRAEMLDCFTACGFSIVGQETRRWDTLPIGRSKLAAPFQRFDDAELTISGFAVIMSRRKDEMSGMPQTNNKFLAK